MDDTKYQIDLKCSNCKTKNWNVKIPKGTTIKEFGEKENKKCSKCDCYLINIKKSKK
jgi:hypothetical protein